MVVHVARKHWKADPTPRVEAHFQRARAIFSAAYSIVSVGERVLRQEAEEWEGKLRARGEIRAV